MPIGRRVLQCLMFVAGALLTVTAATAQPVGKPPAKEPGRVGVVVKGSQAKAPDGYVFEKKPGNQVMARKAGGGQPGAGATTSLSCQCQSGGTMMVGTCTLITTGGTASCSKGQTGTCSASCAWVTISTGMTGGAVMR